MEKKKKVKKKPKIKTYVVEGYYLDRRGAHTIIEDPEDKTKTKMVKGIL